jgi:DNA replication protein DnaC
MGECTLCNGVGIRVQARGDYAAAACCDCKNPCGVCKGSGYFFETDEFGYRLAIPCACTQLVQRARAFTDAQIPARYEAAEFGRIQVDKGASDIVTAKRQAWRFAREYEPGASGILLYGTVGTGKTYLTVAILRYLILSRGVRARFTEFMHLLSDLRATFGDRGQAEVVMRPLVDVPLLVIDELGKGRGSDWELSVLDELISKRYNARRTTVFTTNYGIESSTQNTESSETESLRDRIGVRIHSRLMEMCDPVRLCGVDLRREMRN